MKCLLFSAALLVVVFVIGVAPAQGILKIRDDQVENVKLISSLQGRWKLVGMQKDGKRVADADLRGERVFIREDRLVISKSDGDADVFRFTVDATTNPKQVDLTTIGHDDTVRKLLGIIEQEGNTVRLAVNSGPGDRPTNFRDVGMDVVVLELQRVR